MGVEVATTGGRLTGMDGGGVHAYLGIPYAAAPMGPLRWRPPQPHPGWLGVFDARTFGPAAPQVPVPSPGVPSLDAGPTSEDCLTLNVWSPSGARNRPVAVWIHGGAFITGGSAVPSYGGAPLAASTGMVVVSVNYRLGALGFAPVGGVPNLGLLDQSLALGWVADNIAGFGGDPERVMVFGESAGGGSILHLLCGDHLPFRRAVVQSGATTLALTPDRAAEVADRVKAALAPADALTAPVSEILAVQSRLNGELVSAWGVMPFHPSLDEHPSGRTSGAVDLIVGTTADELSFYAFETGSPDALPEDRLRRRAARYLPRYGAIDADAVLAAYAGLPTTGERWAAMRTDAEMWLPAVSVAAGHPGRAFMYRFDWRAAPPSPLGACHGIDIPFTFDTFGTAGWDRFVGHDERSSALSRGMQGAWAAFAASGDPSCEPLGPWPAYEAPERATMLLSASPAVAADPRGEVRRAWEFARSQVSGQ